MPFVVIRASSTGKPPSRGPGSNSGIRESNGMPRTHPLPDLAGVYQGIEPTLRWWREWLVAWEAVQVEYELVEAGDRVVGLFHQRMRGHYTGIDVASGKYAMVFTFRDGLIVHAKFYARRSEALEAVGLRD